MSTRDGMALIKASQGRRLWALVFFFVLAFVGLGYRCVEIQVLLREELIPLAAANTRKSFVREGRRGDIRDSRGNLLATSRLVKTICADPTLICNTNVGDRRPEVARTLSPLLHLPEDDLVRLLEIHYLTNKEGRLIPDQYVELKRRVVLEDWDRIREAMKSLLPGVEKTYPRLRRAYFTSLRHNAIQGEDDQVRDYPNQRLAAHVLGYVGINESATNTLSRAAGMVGKDGVEMTMNAALNGIRGWVQTEIDVKRRELVVYRKMDVAARTGANVVLTLDLELQHILETGLADAMQKHTPISASAIMIRPQTGELLALATFPNYDPNNPGAYPPECRRNRVIADLSEPGSTFKIVVVAAALNEGLVTLNDQFDCEKGRFFYCGRLLKDHDDGYGVLSVENILVKSSNIGAAKIGIRLGQARLYDYMRSFGFGDRTFLPLPGERLGTVHALKNWTKLSISRIPMGHEVTVTPLQMVMAMGALANGGRLMRPMLIDRLEDDHGNYIVQYRPEMVRQVCTESTARLMVKALQMVVSTNGTAAEAQLEHYQVAGKTGTAQKATAEGYMPGKHFSSFIGFFPAERPEVCIGVFLDEPRHGYYGGRTAAPFFRAIGERAASYLSIRPDRLPSATLAITPGLTSSVTPRMN